MRSFLGDYFNAERLKRNLSLEEMARRLGVKNIRKTASQIGRFEAEGIIKEDLLVLLADALEIGLPVVEQLIELDRQGQGDQSRK
jgi:transcriptional regulator with XRE-family HTH domain